VTNAEKADAIHPNVRLISSLRAFGMALRGSLTASNDLFDRLEATAASDVDKAALRYWRAQALAQTGSKDRAHELLTQTAEYGASNAATLGLLAELMYGKATNHEGVEAALKVAHKALDKDVNDPKGNRLLGLHKARWAEKLKATERRALKREALPHLEKCIAGGEGDAEIYSEISAIYRDLAKALPARESRRKALDLLCSLDEEPVACGVNKIRALLESSSSDRKAEAVKRTNDLLQWLMDNPAAVKPFDRDNMLIEAAIVWYENGDINQSQLLYENVADNLGQYVAADERGVLASQVSCNLGFIYVDKGMTAEAINAFRASLESRGSPDCRAGLAIALKQAGRDDEALKEYKRAKAADANYEGEIDVLKQNNFWSDVACRYLQELATADRPT
jgi:tetratricopeptide (TPR) repeat protein